MRFTETAESVFPGSQLLRADRLTGGVSADVYRLDLRLADGSSTSVVLRIHGDTHSGHPADFEFQLLRALHTQGVRVPKPLMVDTSGELLPHPFLVIAFVEGSTGIPAGREGDFVATMAAELRRIHESDIAELPELPLRLDPLPELLDYLPEGEEWQSLRKHLETLSDTGYSGNPCLLHGDFWPENLLWQNGNLAAVLDWEDAALGDPLSDVAAARVELRYRFGPEAMRWFTEAYARTGPLDMQRLALWQVYVAAAAQKYMGEWRLDPEREAHMRQEALASIREAGQALLNGTSV